MKVHQRTLKNILQLCFFYPLVGFSTEQGIPLSSTPTEVNQWIDTVGFSYGQSKDNIDIYRLTLRKNFSKRWWKSSSGYLNGYWEGSLNYWNGKNNENFGIACSPVFTYCFTTFETFTPYLEAGIGISIFNKTKIDSRDLTTNFLFENRIGTGIKMGNWDLSFRYMHYSNASIKKPNDGIDIFIGSLSWKF